MRTKNCNIQTVKATSRVDALINGASLINAHARKGTDHRAKFCLSTAPNPQYQFSFDVKDDEFTNYQNRKEQREGGKISGSYSVVDSDGFIRTVKYTADPVEGFKAQVTREPTDIVVKIPTPPPVQEQVQQYVARPVPARQPYAQVYNSVAAQPTAEQLAQLRALARQQLQPAPAAAPVQYQGVQPQVQYVPQAEAPRPKAIKAGAIAYAAQQPSPAAYQAYEE